MRESRVFLPPKTHDWVTQLAVDMEERVPMLLGKLIVAQHMMETHESEVTLERPDSVEPFKEEGLPALFLAIFGSRFPGDNGAERFRQVAVVAAIFAETAAGRKPTATTITQLCDQHVTKVSSLAKKLKERGVIEIKHTHSTRKGMASKVYYLLPDAVDRIRSVHLDLTGREIDDFPETGEVSDA